MVRSLILLALTASIAFPQPPEAFELATIKLSDPASPETSFHYDGRGGMKADGTTLADLIRYAYDLRDFQLSGASGWMSSTRYRVVGTGGGKNVPLPVIRKRLQALLSERFQLALHTQSKDIPIYALVLAKGGLRLHRNTTTDRPGGVGSGPSMFRGTATPLDELARGLSGVTGRPVRNDTGLDGLYDIDLHWTPDTAPADAPTGPSLYTALQEQAGLKLEAKRGPVDVTVIDRAERPSEN
jgi:uncharacterized protein (TIGR03435 family)